MFAARCPWDVDVKSSDGENDMLFHMTDSPTKDLSRRRARLLHRIHERYATKTRRHVFGKLTIDFTRIDNPDHVLDQVAEEESRRSRATKAGKPPDDESLRLPYWAQLWDSAPGVGQFLAGGRLTNARGEPMRLPDAAALDLGCGMGLSGTVAAAMGAKVVFADLETPALLFARLNSLPWIHRTRTRRLNWQTDAIEERFDLILGADILYEKSQWDHLEPFWRSHLKPGGIVLLGEPGRQTGTLFVDWIVPRGWRLERFEERVPDFATPIRLMTLRIEESPRRS